MGDGVKKLEGNEQSSVIVQRRSLRAIRDLPVGTVVSDSDLEALRPIPTGAIPPYERPRIVGKKLKLPLKKGEAITWKHVHAK